MTGDTSDNKVVRKGWFTVFHLFPFDATSIPIKQMDHGSQSAGRKQAREQRGEGVRRQGWGVF